MPSPLTPSLHAHGNAVRIKVGVGACVVGAPVRFNGGAKKNSEPIERLAQCFELRPFCPEMAIGLGVPRPPLRVVGAAHGQRVVDSDTGAHDVTAALRASATDFLGANPELCGYIFVKNSPSCGMERVKRYSDSGVVLGNDAVGAFAAALMAADPLLPVEEDGRLHDEHLCESFVARVFTYSQWRELCRSGLTQRALQQFYARHKYLIMSRHVPTYRELGPLLATPTEAIDELAARVIGLIMTALRKPSTRAGHTNALQHICGYLKNDLSKEEKYELKELIEQYRIGHVPLVVPLTLLRHHFRQFPDTYIEQQLFMRPYPDALRLRNSL